MYCICMYLYICDKNLRCSQNCLIARPYLLNFLCFCFTRYFSLSMRKEPWNYFIHKFYTQCVACVRWMKVIEIIVFTQKIRKHRSFTLLLFCCHFEFTIFGFILLNNNFIEGLKFSYFKHFIGCVRLSFILSIISYHNIIFLGSFIFAIYKKTWIIHWYIKFRLTKNCFFFFLSSSSFLSLSKLIR